MDATDPLIDSSYLTVQCASVLDVAPPKIYLGHALSQAGLSSGFSITVAAQPQPLMEPRSWWEDPGASELLLLASTSLLGCAAGLVSMKESRVCASGPVHDASSSGIFPGDPGTMLDACEGLSQRATRTARDSRLAGHYPTISVQPAKQRAIFRSKPPSSHSQKKSRSDSATSSRLKKLAKECKALQRECVANAAACESVTTDCDPASDPPGCHPGARGRHVVGTWSARDTGCSIVDSAVDTSAKQVAQTSKPPSGNDGQLNSVHISAELRTARAKLRYLLQPRCVHTAVPLTPVEDRVFGYPNLNSVRVTNACRRRD